MKITTTIKGSEFLALVLFPLKKELIRDDPTTGICLSIENGVMRLIATDRLMMVVLKNGKNPFWAGINIIIPLDIIKQVKKTLKKYDNVLLEYDTDNESLVLTDVPEKDDRLGLSVKDDNVKCTQYVDWRNVLPEPFTPSFNFYRISQLEVFDKAAKLLGVEPVFYHNMDSVGVVVIPLDDKIKTLTGFIVPQFKTSDIIADNTITGKVDVGVWI